MTATNLGSFTLPGCPPYIIHRTPRYTITEITVAMTLPL
jgi:hypothetical protein